MNHSRQVNLMVDGKPQTITTTATTVAEALGQLGMPTQALAASAPLGALIPVRAENLLPANKNIGTTHITNGCYRLHPVEWSIGEAVGALAVIALIWWFVSRD